MRKLLSIHHPTHVLPAFDFGGSTWRNEIHPCYRENREPMPAPLREALPMLYERLHELGLHVVCQPGVEADDVIATVVSRWLREDRGEAVVVANDKDTYLLMAQGARFFEYFTGEWRDHAWVEQKYGVPPLRMPDLLALCGDDADGVPGVTGIGVKKAAKLLQSYGDLDGIMAGAGILKDRLGETLRKEKELLFLSRDLVRLKTDVQLGITWNTLSYDLTSN
jgi:DNA polymerase-1